MMVNCLKSKKNPVTTPGQGVDSGFFGRCKETPQKKNPEPVPEAVPFRQFVLGFIKSTSYGMVTRVTGEHRTATLMVQWVDCSFCKKSHFCKPNFFSVWHVDVQSL